MSPPAFLLPSPDSTLPEQAPPLSRSPFPRHALTLPRGIPDPSSLFPVRISPRMKRKSLGRGDKQPQSLVSGRIRKEKSKRQREKQLGLLRVYIAQGRWGEGDWV